MAEAGRKKHFSFSIFRRRQQAANNRRFCMTWINKMVNKQVEKRIAEMKSEFFLRKFTMKEQMLAELKEQLKELEAEEVRARYLHYIKLCRVQTMMFRAMEEVYEDDTEEDEEDDAKSLEEDTLSFNFSETSFDTNCIYIMMKALGDVPDVKLKILFDESSDGDTSDGDTNLQPAQSEQQENQQISSDVATSADTSQLLEESDEEEISRNPFHAIPDFMTEELRCEEERVQVDRRKDEEALLMGSEWQEWMDKQEMGGNPIKVKPAYEQNTEKPGGAAAPVSEKQIEENVEEAGTVKKIKTYLSNIWNPQSSNKWKRLEEED